MPDVQSRTAVFDLGRIVENGLESSDTARAGVRPESALPPAL